MSLIDAISGPVDTLRGGPTYDPIIRSLPSTTRALSNKYSKPEVQTAISQLPMPLRNSLLQLDAKRAARGQTPLSLPQTLNAIRAVQTNTEITPAPKPNPFLPSSLAKNAIGDLKAITMAIPKLPGAMVDEVRALSHISDQDPQNLADYLRLPGVRFIPGTATVANLASGQQGIEDIASHPLLTALDVLPLAQAKLLKGITKGAANRSILQATAATRPGQAVGRARAGLVTAAGRTAPGQALKQAFGKTARDVVYGGNMADARLRDQIDPTGGVYDNVAVALTRQGRSLDKDFPGIDPARKAQLKTAAELDDQTVLSTLNDVERGYIDRARALTDDYARLGEKQEFLTQIDGEMYDTPTATRILNARKTRDVFSSLANVRKAITEPSDVAQLARTFRDDIYRENLSTKQRIQVAQGYIHALDSSGIDNTNALATLKKYRRNEIPFDDVIATIDDTLAQPTARAGVRSADEIIDQLRPFGRTDGKIAVLTDALRAGRFKDAKTIARQLSKRTKFTVPELDSILDNVGRLADREKFLSQTSQYSERVAARLSKRADDLVARTPPARFMPLIDKAVGEKIKLIKANDQNIDQITQAVAERNFSAIPDLDHKELRAFQNEVKATWQTLKANGADPMFVHRVTPSQAASINFPHVMEKIPTLGQARARTLDASPSVNDLSVSLTHQGMEILRKQGAEETVASIMERYGRSADELRELYSPAARRAAEYNPQIDFQAHLDAALGKDYVQYDPTNIITWKSPRLSGLDADKTFVPREVAGVLKSMHEPMNNGLTRTLDPFMKVFRTAVLPLSARWHFYNLFGGAMMLVGQTDPTVFRFLGDARKLLNGEEVLIKGKPVAQSEFMRLSRGSSTRLNQEFNARAGVTSNRLMQEVSNSRAAKAAGGVVAKSFEINGFVDDMYRAMGYLYGYDKALSKGLTKAERIAAGETVARKAFQTWAELTPMERSVMRYIFPFYGFTQHILRYSMRYPMDHPFRTAVLGAVSRAEMEDATTGLPEKYLNSFFLGPQDQDGNVKTLNLGGMNPFRDVANYFTLAGFASQLNPLASTLLESLGVDTQTGAPELFPNLQYDPETGRLGVKPNNPLELLVQNTLPQSQILTGMFQSSSEFKQLMRDNPEAATRLLRSQLGLPILFRNVNVPQEQIKSELAREESQQKALSEALKSGNDANARQYANLDPLLTQIRTLQAQGRLADYTPANEQAMTPLELAQAAIIRSNIPSGVPQ